MKVRNTPCIECRNHRRKCVRPSLNHHCSRCERLGKICQQPPAKQKEQLYEQFGAGEDGEDGENQDIDSLKHQVNQLEKAVFFMEKQLQMCRSNNMNCTSSSSSSISISSDSNKLPLVRKDRQPLSELSNTMIQSLFQNWKFKIENGSFQIETGIRNISELLQFDPSVTYLSPLSGSQSGSASFSFLSSSNNSDSEDGDSYYRGCDAGIILSFGKEGNGGLIPFTIKILTRCIKTKPSKTPSALLLPSTLLLDPDLLLDQLLHIYFECHNIHHPFVHEQSYRAKLATIQDPLTDLVTLGICSYVSCTPCEHLQFSPRERRNMGDYFHAKARNIILDQFDLPEKKLENVIGINLLIRYMHVTLKFAECRQLVSIAYQILLDLRNDYPEFRASGPNACFQSLPQNYTHAQEPITDVDKMLFTRHVTISMTITRFMDYITNDLSDNAWLHLPTWEYLEDEPEETKRFIQSQNWVINLYNHAFVKTFLKQIHRVHLGRICTLSFESIVRIEDVMQEWASSIPSKFKLCDDLYDSELCYKAIDQATDSVLLTNFIQFHIFHVSIYSCLVQPKSLSDHGQELLSWVQEHSLTKALKSCQLLLHAIHRLAVANSTSCIYILSASEFLFHALDVLVLLALSHNKHIAKEARLMMKSCLSELDAIKFVQGHQVPPEDLTSPRAIHMFDIMSGDKFDIDYYDQFPHPWFNMMYDASHFITSQ